MHLQPLVPREATFQLRRSDLQELCSKIRAASSARASSKETISVGRVADRREFCEKGAPLWRLRSERLLPMPSERFDVIAAGAGRNGLLSARRVPTRAYRGLKSISIDPTTVGFIYGMAALA